MQLCLDWRWRNFEDLDARTGISELVPEAKGKAVEGSFGSRVRRHVPCWNNGEIGAGAAVVSDASWAGHMQCCYLQDNTRSGLFRLEEGEEGGGDVDEAGEVDAYLLVESGEVDLVGLGEVIYALDSGIKEDTIEVGVDGRHGMHEFVQVLVVGDVVRDPTSSITVLTDEFVDSILSTANGNDFGALVDELLCHAQANA